MAGLAMRATEIRDALEEILPQVQKPTRYLGLERNLVRKKWDAVALHVALVFPDVYEIGMSHLGSHILYHLINRRPDSLAERSYAPWPDMATALRNRSVPLYTLESYTAVHAFDIVGISLQSELNYSNVPWVLELSGIPVWAHERTDEHPLVIGGGPCVANPEPVAELFDAIVLGDAEPTLDPLLSEVARARAAGSDRATTLLGLAQLPGVYVPHLYQFTPGSEKEPGQWQVADERAPLPAQRVFTPHLAQDDVVHTPIMPFHEVVQDRLGVEIMRGCTRGCRFCQAGYWYRPVRERDPEDIIATVEAGVAATGAAEVGLLSLSSSDYSEIEPLTATLASRLSERRVSLSLPSLRADSFSLALAEAVSQVRKGGFTFAVEAGSERLRRVINKSLTNADLLQAGEGAFSRGWNLVKIYAMIGLPTETDDDLVELAELVKELAQRGRKLRGNKAVVKLSVGCFVPKPWTPFQWEAFVDVAELQRRREVLRRCLGTHRSVHMTCSRPEDAALEALLARGDRRLARTIVRAAALGACFDGWSDLHDREAWRQALQETAVDLDAALGKRDLSATLPWEVVAAGVTRKFLLAERRRAHKGLVTEDCRNGACYHCGLIGQGAEVRLSQSSLPTTPTAPSLPRPSTAGVTPQRFRVVFSKTGDARFLSHRQVMDAIARALRSARAPVQFTQGFNPHVRLSMGPALPTGYEGLRETFDVKTRAPLLASILEHVNRYLPTGLQLEGARELLLEAPSLGKMIAAARYRVAPSQRAPWPASPPPSLAQRWHRGVRHWQLQPSGELVLELNLLQQHGPTPTVKQVLLALGLDDQAVLRARVVREQLVLQPPQRPLRQN